MTLRDRMAQCRERVLTGGWTLLPLRLVVGFGFAAHGYAKLARGPEAFAHILATMGIPAPRLMAWVTALVELLGGVAIMLGICVATFAVPLAFVMTTAILGVHLRYGFSSVRLRGLSASGAEFGPVGYELNLLYIAALVTLALGRPSALSVDQWLAARRTLGLGGSLDSKAAAVPDPSRAGR